MIDENSSAEKIRRICIFHVWLFEYRLTVRCIHADANTNGAYPFP